MYQMNTQEFRQWMRLERAERVRKDRLEVAKQRKAAYRQAYWMRALRFETFKVGGLRFIKLGRLSVSLCVTSPRGEA